MGLLFDILAFQMQCGRRLHTFMHITQTPQLFTGSNSSISVNISNKIQIIPH